jgi:translation initiation factor 2B subunit (eIF-2B alpha/beta/delta family)
MEQVEYDVKLMTQDMARLTKQVEKLVEELKVSNDRTHQSELRQERVLSNIDRMMEEVERAHSRIDTLDIKSSDFSAFKTKVITYGTVGSVVLAFITQFIVKHFG